MTARVAGSSRTFRVFVSSTFNDFIEERNALQRYVFPRLAELCASRQGRFQAIDLRWGVSEEAGLDQRAVAICLDEIARCQRLTPRPNFIILLGDRYGWRPLPARIEKKEFEAILAKVPDAGPDSGRALLSRWYRLDENAVPAEYVLLPREVEVPEGATADARKAAQTAEYEKWRDVVEPGLRAALLAAIDGLGWAESDSRRDKYVASATEQEIDRGALKVKDAADHVFCFRRSITNLGELVKAIPPEPPKREDGVSLAEDFIDLIDPVAVRRPDEEAGRQLEDLKSRLKVKTCDYRAVWKKDRISVDHIGALPETLDECLKLLEQADLPHTLCNDVWRNLASMILAQLDELGAVEAVEAEVKAHEAFGKDRCRVFVGRDKPLAAIAHYLRADGHQPLAVIGEPGSGKSALMAKAFERAKAAQKEGFTVVRFIGATPGSSDGRTLLGNLCRQITREYGADESTVPTEYNDLAVEFGKRLELATAQRPLIVFLDALDQLGATDPARALSWLPPVLPDHVRLVVSAVPGDCEGALKAKRPGLAFLTLDRMSKKEGETALGQWLEKAGRTLRDHQREEVIAKFEPEGRPLYLKLAFEEARLWPSYDDPRRRALREGIPELIRENLFHRLATPASHGRMLVSHALGYLAASRYGLSEDELIDVLSADEELKADFLRRSPRSPKVDRLPVVVWSRLYFDLEPYLAEHAGEGATLLAFYHRQLSEAATREYLGDGEGATRHKALATYFRGKADLAGGGKWQPKGRPLTELPFHLAGGGLNADLAQLLSDLSYLAARVACSPAHGLVGDYSLGNPEPSPSLLAWRTFLQKHAQRLTEHPSSLLALVNHEGFAEAREQIPTAYWPGAWIRTAPEPMPELESENAAGPKTAVQRSISFDHNRLIAVAAERSMGFCLERLGELRVLDLASMREVARTLPIAPGRPLAIACAPDAGSVAVLYESGVAVFYKCLPGLDEWPAGLEVAAELRFRLPEFSDPVVVWDSGTYWLQAERGCLVKVSGGGNDVSEDHLPIEEADEVSALVFTSAGRLAAVRHGRDTLLFTDDVLTEKRADVDVCGACQCGVDAAVAYSDGSLVVYEREQALPARLVAATGVVRGSIGWDGDSLVWLTEKAEFKTWRPGAPAAVSVADDEVFGGRLRGVPRHWIVRPEGTMLVTSNSVVVYRLEQAGTETSFHIDGLLGGPVWRAIDWRRPDWWLVDSKPLRRILLQRDVQGRLFYDLDGKGQLYAASGNGPGVLLDVETAQSSALMDCPAQINSAVADRDGGCWFATRVGDIYFADADGSWSHQASVGRPNVHGAQLVDCLESLVWWGRSTHDYATGPEPATTFVFFRKVGRSQIRLERMGMQLIHPDEGWCKAVWYRQSDGVLWALWAVPGGGTEPYRLRFGTKEDWASGRVQETRLAGLPVVGFEKGALSADGRLLGLVSSGGEFFCVDLSKSAVAASLAGSVWFSEVAPGPAGSTFWLAEGQSQLYRCSFVGGDA
jgi:hypothetical protein